jgi:hypothetical protein
MADKKISELPIASAIGADDISLVVSNSTDYQFPFSTLLSFVETNLQVGAKITFGAVIPQNTTGSNGDVFFNTDTRTFYQKVNGTWSVTYTTIDNSAADGTLLYGTGAPGSGTGADNDSYIDTSTGIFYLKTSGAWAQVFSMATGPQGPQGTAGANGTNHNKWYNKPGQYPRQQRRLLYQYCKLLPVRPQGGRHLARGRVHNRP